MVLLVEVPSSPEDEEDPDEMDADLLGRSTGRMFGRGVPMIARRPKPQQLEPKPQQPGPEPQQSEPQPQQPEPQPKQLTKPKQPEPKQPLRRSTRTAKKKKMFKRRLNQGGYTDRGIIGTKAKVIAELEQLAPAQMPLKDQDRDQTGRALHFPPATVLQPDTGNELTCYLPVLRFATGLRQPVAPSVSKILSNADSSKINKALEGHTGLTMSHQPILSNNYVGLLQRKAGTFIFVGKTGERRNHWGAYNAWSGVLYDGGDKVRIVEDSDRVSNATGKAVFVGDMQFDDLREV